jgi:molybdopterin-guanine dinucleotide biosynthesis protein A
MGLDKGTLVFRGKSLVLRGAESLSKVVSPVVVSFRKNQMIPRSLKDLSIPILEDQYPEIGPAAGLLTAYLSAPESDWFVFACDFPLAEPEAFSFLLKSRKPGVTCFMHSGGTPEPLFAIWDQDSLQKLKINCENGKTGPIQTLREVPHHLISPLNPDWLNNTNSKEEWERLLARSHDLSRNPLKRS